MVWALSRLANKHAHHVFRPPQAPQSILDQPVLEPDTLCYSPRRHILAILLVRAAKLQVEQMDAAVFQRDFLPYNCSIIRNVQFQ